MKVVKRGRKRKREKKATPRVRARDPMTESCIRGGGG